MAADDLAADVDRAADASSALLKLRADLAEAWALAPDDEPVQETVERLLGAYVRAAYGCGYVDALTDGPEPLHDRRRAC